MTLLSYYGIIYILCVFLIATYAVGFNLLCSYNLQSTFAAYEFYDVNSTPLMVGIILSLLTAYCLFGGGKRIITFTSFIVPLMGLSYVAVSLVVILVNWVHIPAMFAMIFKDAFDLKAIFGAVSGSCMIYGIKRGLYSNEAASSAILQHEAASLFVPVKNQSL